MVNISSKNIVFPKKIVIGTCTYNVIANPEMDGGSFDTADCNLTIGIKSLKADPVYVWSVINHELMEIVFTMFRVRYNDPSVEKNYKFFMDHKEFEICIAEFSKLIVQFIKTKK